jgi:hypothetical protein
VDGTRGVESGSGNRGKGGGGGWVGWWVLVS